jgi:hypothetical protein
VKQELKNLGIIKADPNEYIEKYGNSLKSAADMPQFVLDIETPKDLSLAANFNYSNNIYELEGNLEALKLIDLDREGLSEYRPQLEKIGLQFSTNNDHFTSTISVNSSVWY